MKTFKAFINESKKDTITFSFGRFNCPTTGHLLLIQKVKDIAKEHNSDYVIYASRTQDKKKNPLSLEQKMHYLNIISPNTNFKGASDKERTFIEVAKELNKKYKNLIMVAGSDRIESFDMLLNKYNGVEFNYDSIKVISAGERDPDADDATGMSGTKMRDIAVKGDYEEFKKGLPTSMKEIDGRKMMDDVKTGMGK